MDLFSLNIGFKVSLNTSHFDKQTTAGSEFRNSEFNTHILYIILTVGFYLVLLLLCINQNNNYNNANNKRP